METVQVCASRNQSDSLVTIINVSLLSMIQEHLRTHSDGRTLHRRDAISVRFKHAHPLIRFVLRFF